MADRQSNTHQPKYKIISSLRGKTFTRNMYSTSFGAGKMKELIRTQTPFTDWDIDNDYKIKTLIHMGANNILVARPIRSLPSDFSLSRIGLWPIQWEKYSGSTKRDTLYYYGHTSEVETGELPWEYTAYNSEGTLVAKYVIHGTRDSNEVGSFTEDDWGTWGTTDCSTTKGHEHSFSFLNMNKKIRNDKTLKEELLAFVDTHNLTLPDHDIDDPRMYQIGVGYRNDGTTPITIQYFIYQLKDLEGGRLTGA